MEDKRPIPGWIESMERDVKETIKNGGVYRSPGRKLWVRCRACKAKVDVMDMENWRTQQACPKCGAKE